MSKESVEDVRKIHAVMILEGQSQLHSPSNSASYHYTVSICLQYHFIPELESFKKLELIALA